MRRTTAVIAFAWILDFTAVVNADPVAPDLCATHKSDVIVICGSRSTERYRLPRLDERFESKRLRAETDAIPGVHARAHAEAERMPDGKISKTLLVTFSLPF